MSLPSGDGINKLINKYIYIYIYVQTLFSVTQITQSSFRRYYKWNKCRHLKDRAKAKGGLHLTLYLAIILPSDTDVYVCGCVEGLRVTEARY